MMYNRNPMTPLELANDQTDNNPRLSGKSITSNDHVANMEHIYQHMLAKAHSNIKK